MAGKTALGASTWLVIILLIGFSQNAFSMQVVVDSLFVHAVKGEAWLAPDSIPVKEDDVIASNGTILFGSDSTLVSVSSIIKGELVLKIPKAEGLKEQGELGYLIAQIWLPLRTAGSSKGTFVEAYVDTISKGQLLNTSTIQLPALPVEKDLYMILFDTVDTPIFTLPFTGGVISHDVRRIIENEKINLKFCTDKKANTCELVTSLTIIQFDKSALRKELQFIKGSFQNHETKTGAKINVSMLYDYVIRNYGYMTIKVFNDLLNGIH